MTIETDQDLQGLPLDKKLPVVNKATDRSRFFARLTLATVLLSILTTTPLHAQNAIMGMAANNTARANQGEPLKFLKPVVNVELSFIKRACDPSEEQMKAIVAAATEAYEATGDMIAEDPQRIQAGQVQIRGPNNELLNENPFHRIRRDAREYLKPLVSNEQYARYQTEADQRDKFERSAAVAMVVGMIDEKIALTDEQRPQTTDLLMEKWKDIDLQSIQNYVYNPQYVPQLPSGTIETVLTKRQWKAWESYTQVNFGMNFNLGNNPVGLSDEEWIP